MSHTSFVYNLSDSRIVGSDLPIHYTLLTRHHATMLPRRPQHICYMILFIAILYLSCLLSTSAYHNWENNRRWHTVPTGFSSNHTGWYNRSTSVNDITNITLHLNSDFSILKSVSNWGRDEFEIAIVHDGVVITRTGVTRLTSQDFNHFKTLSQDVRQYNKQLFDSGSPMRDLSTSKISVALGDGDMLHFSLYGFDRDHTLAAATPLPTPLLELFGLLSPREEFNESIESTSEISNLVEQIEAQLKKD